MHCFAIPSFQQFYFTNIIKLLISETVMIFHGGLEFKYFFCEVLLYFSFCVFQNSLMNIVCCILLNWKFCMWSHFKILNILLTFLYIHLMRILCLFLFLGLILDYFPLADISFGIIKIASNFSVRRVYKTRKRALK